MIFKFIMSVQIFFNKICNCYFEKLWQLYDIINVISIFFIFIYLFENNVISI